MDPTGYFEEVDDYTSGLFHFNDWYIFAPLAALRGIYLNFKQERTLELIEDIECSMELGIVTSVLIQDLQRLKQHVIGNS
jgi:hypothetical protein